MDNEIWTLDGRPLEDDCEYITFKVKLPVYAAKTLARNTPSASASTIAIAVRESVKKRLKVDIVKSRYTADDIQIGLVYEFKYGKRNRYRIATISDSRDAIITQRLNSNLAGQAGELLWTDKGSILEYLNSGRAQKIASTRTYEEAYNLP